jgi:hypothetical protein
LGRGRAGGDVARVAAAAGEGRKDEAVFQVKVAELEGLE